MLFTSDAFNCNLFSSVFVITYPLTLLTVLFLSSITYFFLYNNSNNNNSNNSNSNYNCILLLVIQKSLLTTQEGINRSVNEQLIATNNAINTHLHQILHTEVINDYHLYLCKLQSGNFLLLHICSSIHTTLF